MSCLKSLSTEWCRGICITHLKNCSLVHTSAIRRKQENLRRLLLNSMPKLGIPKETLRHVKYREKRAQGGHKMPAPSRIDIQVIGSGARGTPKSIVISTDYSRYLFNCGEGTQRIAQEQKIKLAKLENVFITYKSWENLGGLLGMGLTLESINVPKITLHGPDGIEKVVQMAKSFNSQHSTIKLEKKALSEGKFEDTAVVVDYVRIWKEGASNPSQAEVTRETEDSAGTHFSDFSSDDPKPKRQCLEEISTDQEYTVAYICQPRPPLRKLLIEKCVELGVPSGPLCGKLKEGEDVVLANGTVITSDQVLSEPEIRGPVIVLECPSEAFLKSLGQCEAFQQYRFTEEDSRPTPSLIIHMSPVRVMETPEYQTWMNMFGPVTKHLVLNENTSEVAFEGLYRIQTILNLIDRQIFPLLPHQTKEQTISDSGNVVMARTNLVYQYRPKQDFIRDFCISLDTHKFVEAVKEQPGVSEELDRLQKSKAEQTGEDGCDSCYPEVIFLGTGSAIPSKARNVSCILLQMEKQKYMLMDCGEGTLGQMYRHFGCDVDDVLENLNVIFVSHMHADHHLGMFGVLEARKQVLESRGRVHSPVLLLAPVQMNRWLRFYSQQIKESQSYIRLVALQDLMPHQLERTMNLYTGVLEEINLKELVLVDVDHCRNAFGVCLTHHSGWKLVYSGDTMPCNRLVRAGEGCDLLIHEATMEDDLEDEAKYKTHSTTSQAIDVGIRMKASFILLTHFSQRYSKVPVINEKFSDKVGIAFDNMRVRMSDLTSLPLFTRALKVVFAEEYACLEERSVKRNLTKRQKKIGGERLFQEFLTERADGGKS